MSHPPCSICGKPMVDVPGVAGAFHCDVHPDPLGFRIDEALAKVKAEIIRAKNKHPGDFHGPHEAYAILLEEVDELWDEIKADHYDGTAQTEAMQLAAMAVRYMIEIPIKPNKVKS